MYMNLEGRWEALQTKLGIKVPVEIFTAFYNDQRRSYHCLEHISACLDHLEDYCSQNVLPQKSDVELAIWWHDIIYSCSYGHDEQQSANLMLALIGFEKGTTAHRMILDSANHMKSLTNLETYAKVFLDIDMSILGVSSPVYDEYAQRIREEVYNFQGNMMEMKKFNSLFDAGRKNFLSGVLKKDRIYYSEFFFNKLEAQARKNLSRELESL